MHRQIIAYEGSEFTIEWYYDLTDKSQSLEYFESLSLLDKTKLFYLFKRIGEAGTINDKSKFNYEGDQIYAFKPKPNRFLCFFFKQKKIIVTNAFCKKQQKLSHVEKEKALKNKRSYQFRVEQGEYYD